MTKPSRRRRIQAIRAAGRAAIMEKMFGTKLDLFKMNNGEYYFRCGHKIFGLTKEQLAKVPALEAIMNSLKKVSRVATLNPEIYKPDFMQVIINYVKTGHEADLFGNILSRNTQTSGIFKLLDLLMIEKPAVMTWTEIDRGIKSMKYLESTFYKSMTLEALRKLACDTAVKFCWIAIDLMEKEKDKNDQCKIFNLVEFILAHPNTFHLRLRQLTLDWYLNNLYPTKKQRQVLFGWIKKFRLP